VERDTKNHKKRAKKIKGESTMIEIPEVTEKIIESKLSAVAKRTTASIIRELLKSTSIPDMISFGGGVPDPETFPREHLAEIAKEIIEKEYKITLQYGTTEGDKLLKQQYINYLLKYEGIDGLEEDNMVITSGSQQALDLVGRTFLDERSICAISDPVYLGAASAFMVHGPKFLTLPLHSDGPDLDVLEDGLQKLTDDEKERFKFFYLVSNFDNPTGTCLSLEKRLRILDIAVKYKILIVEDDPYGLLRFDGEKIPPIYKLAKDQGLEDYVLLMNTFSKILSPGLRMGIVIGNKKVIRRIVLGKQAADLCTSPLLQRLTARYMERHDPIVHLQNALKVYRKKRDTMMEAFLEDFGTLDGICWTNPQGGLFSWMCFPDWVDTMEMLDIAKKNSIIYIPGEAFSVKHEDKNCMRLSFCLPTEPQIREGSKRLLKSYLHYKTIKGRG
jgi:DNA-binding transcriptional MocR family regulator